MPIFNKIKINLNSYYKFHPDYQIKFYFNINTILYSKIPSQEYNSISQCLATVKHAVYTEDLGIQVVNAERVWPEVALRALTVMLKNRFFSGPEEDINLLINTGSDYLEYDTEDDFLGAGSDGQGLNLYGVALMRARDYIIENKKKSM